MKPHKCPQCNGTGHDTAGVYKLADIVRIREGPPNCKVCAGTGLVVAYRGVGADERTTMSSQKDNSNGNVDAEQLLLFREADA